MRYFASHNIVLTLSAAASTLGTVLYIKTALSLSSTASDQLYGLIGAVLAGGLALASWLIGLLDERISKRAFVLYAPLGTGLLYLLFIFHPDLALVLFLFLGISAGTACSLLPRQALMARSIPNNLRGRIYSCFNALTALTNIVAYGLFASLGLLLPPGLVLALAGAILLLGIPLCTFVFKGQEAFKEIER